MSVVYQIEALFVLFSVVLSILIRTKYFWIGMHMSKKRPFLAGVGLNLRGVLTREIYGSHPMQAKTTRKSGNNFIHHLLLIVVVLYAKTLPASNQSQVASRKK
jgi:hypothetical protein